ncbi:MAG TPA: D-aminoacyl-tRNA deacylase [Syntrophorhabdaceae bacterium]|nr:D-aminoacyl-tRNA deacylase [Syntrophorhabdaceae bacterium]HQK46855.1 D-aminoacyl-tRNA deacylase [Syntrophorhabdaceae bacterium]
MRAVLQRVRRASVEVDGQVVGTIGNGLLVFLGIGSQDTEQDIQWMVDKIINLRIFEREKGRMNESLLDMGGEVLVVSQFTLYGDCSKGRRPSFSGAMPSHEAKKVFDTFLERMRQRVDRVESGIFQAYMDVNLINEGPVTMILDSKEVKSVRL